MKKIFTLTVLLVFIICMPAFAGEINVNYDNDDVNVCVISGNDDLPYNTEMTLIVFKNGKSISDISDDVLQNDGIVVCTDVTSVDEDGNWKFEWEPGTSGYYDIYVSASSFDSPYCLDNKFLAAERTMLKQTLAFGSEEDVRGIVKDDMKARALVSDDKIIDDVKKLEKVSDIILTIREELDDRNETINYFELAVYMELLNENPTYKYLDRIVDLCKDLDIDLTNSDLYVDDASESIRQNLAVRLSQCVYSGIEKFDEQFGEQLILAAVESTESWVGLDKYLKLLNHPKYDVNKSKIGQGVVKKNFTSIDSLNKYIDGILKEKASGGNSGSGGSVSQVISYPADRSETAVIINPNENKVTSEENKVTFNDVPQSHWAFDCINYLRWQGKVSGDEKGNYNPESDVTRAEYVKMLCKLFNIEEENDVSFDDVGEDGWFKGYVAAAKKKGLINGDGVNFYPNSNITRQDMAVMTYNFAKNAGIEFSDTYNNFLDFNIVSDYAKDAIGYLAGAKVINGTPDGTFEPENNLTRAEAAKVIYSIMTELVGE